MVRFRQTKYIVMKTKRESTKIVNFMISGAGVCARVWPYTSYSENALFLKNLLLYSGAWFSQTSCIVMFDKQKVFQNSKFMTPEVGVLVLRCDHKSHRVKNQCNIFFSSPSDIGTVYQLWSSNLYRLLGEDGSTIAHGNFTFVIWCFIGVQESICCCQVLNNR